MLGFFIFQIMKKFLKVFDQTNAKMNIKPILIWIGFFFELNRHNKPII